MGREIGGDVGGAGARCPGLDATAGCLDFILNATDRFPGGAKQVE